MRLLIAVLKYVIVLGAVGGLLYLSFQSIEPGPGETRGQFLLAQWRACNFWFLLLSGLAALVSHVVRAERWKLLLEPLGHKPRLVDTTLSVLIGYFVNLAIPRGGEISRCATLNRLDRTPVNMALGTVVAERVIDLVFLLLCIGGAFLVEYDTLMHYFTHQRFENPDGVVKPSRTWLWLLIGGIVAVGTLFLWIMIKKRPEASAKVMTRIRGFLTGLKKGLLSVFRLKQRLLFLFYSLLIWALYYLMLYLVIKSFPATAHLGPEAALTIFTIGAIAMSIPIPGGTGTYHQMVSTGLFFLYTVNQSSAVAFATIFHGWQTLVLILFGGASLLFAQRIVKSRKLKLTHAAQREKNL